MTDRELLELAAKADGRSGYIHEWVNGPQFITPGENPIVWNPLSDDGDALRLAVKLRFGLKDFAPEVFEGLDTPGMIEVWREDDDDPLHVEWLKPSADRYAATRRCIVRAAAEIGKAMP